METPTKKTEIKPIRVGIVGAGLMGRWHARAARKSGGEIVGIVDVDKNRAANLAAKCRTAQSFAGAAEMFNQISPDVLHVCTTTASHIELAELAIKSGVHLFIEKPIAQTAEETVYLYDLAAKNNVRICPVHQFAFQQGVEKAQKLLLRIGRIIHMQATIQSAGGKNLADKELDSIAADILPHPLSLFQSILSELLPEDDWKVFRPEAGELRIFGQAREISLSIFVSMSARPTVNYLQIVGTDGTIYLDLFHGFAFMETGKVSRTRKILHPFDFAVKIFSAAASNLLRRTVQNETAYPGLQRLVNNFYHSIRENTEPPISPEQAINVARVRGYLIGLSQNGKF